jgi:hypothetical protein
VIPPKQSGGGFDVSDDDGDKSKSAFNNDFERRKHSTYEEIEPISKNAINDNGAYNKSSGDTRGKHIIS